MDGDIIVFQREDLHDDPSLELPSCRDYFRDLFYRVEVSKSGVSSDVMLGLEGVCKEGTMCLNVVGIDEAFPWDQK